MAAIAPASTAELLELLKKSNVLPAARLKALPDASALPADPRKGATVLVQKGFITKFQGAQLLAGRHKGFRIGPYAVLDQLGRGGMGAVYLGEHLDLNRKVAIKVLAPAKGDGQHLAAERFLREARAAAALDHPNIVRVFDVSWYNDTPYLVMEYVDGETLQQMLDRDGSVPFGAAAEYTAQAAAGLQHAHERGFVHRDIKPANLILDRSGVVKVLDMGLARDGSARDKLTEQLDEGAVVGTADFISPEQAINSPHVDGRADIYSLGATLFTLLAGRTPFEGNTTQKLMQHQMKPAPALTGLNPGLPAGLADVVARMLAKKPGDRYQTGAEVAAALAPWVGASAHVAAGLSRTSLGQSAALRERAGLSSGALRRAGGGDSGVVDTSDPENATGVVSSDETVRNRPPIKPAPAAPRRAAVVAGLAAVLLAAVAVGGWLAFGRDKAPEGATNTPPEPKLPGNTIPPKVEPKAPAERVLYRLDLSGVSPFVVRTLNVADPNGPKKKLANTVSRGGDGVPPTGWTGRAYGRDAEMEFFADVFGGRTAVGVRNTAGTPSAMLLTPTFDSTAASVRLRVEYQASAQKERFVVKFRPNDNSGAWEVARPEPTGDAWRADEFVVDLKGAPGGCFEFHNSDDAPTAALRVCALVLTELPAPVAVPPLTGPDGKGWTEGKSVYSLDVAKIPAFRVTKEKDGRVSGEPEKLPNGLSCLVYREKGVGEFRRDTFEGSPALGLTNLNDAKSAQFYFSLEGALKVQLTPGRTYRVKVSYRTAGDATGSAAVHTPDYKAIVSAALAPSGGEWKTATATFVRAPLAAGVDVRLGIDNTAVGEGNTVWFRSVEIVELNPPKRV